MKYLKVIIFFIAVVPAIEAVINGSSAKHGQFPYMVGLLIKSNNVINCGGAIITNRLIISTAHCLCDKWSYSYYYAFVGSRNVEESGYYYDLENSICHEFFVPSQLANDIGLAKTTEPIEFNINVQYIGLQMDIIPAGKFLTATGWGCVDNAKTIYPDILKYGYLELVDMDTCHQTFWAALEFTFLCVVRNSQSGLCAGDSGAPLAYQGRLAGVSFGSSIDNDIILMISEYRNWIQQKIYQHNRDENGRWYEWEVMIFNYTYNYNMDMYLEDDIING